MPAIAGRPATVRTSGTEGTPATAGPQATSTRLATAMTPALKWLKHEIFVAEFFTQFKPQ